MRIKYDIAQDILIYVLTLIALIFSILVFNHYYFKDYYSLESQYTIVNKNGLNVIDEHGQNINHQITTQYRSQHDQVKHLQKQELASVCLIAIIGFIIIIKLVAKKIKLITDTLDTGIINLEQLQPIETSSKYQEINKINHNLNQAITTIKYQDTIRNNLYENIIHDFSTPLHILKGNLELINHGLDIDINVLNSQVSRLDYLINLNVVKQQYNHQLLTSEDLYKHLELLKQLYPKHKFLIKIDDNFKLTTAIENFYRVIDNIVNNAVKHGNPETITITLQKENQSYQLTISNDGSPIDNEIISYLFARNTTTTGTGIGLDIVNQIIIELGYQIDIESTPVRTTFTINMPVLEDYK